MNEGKYSIKANFVNDLLLIPYTQILPFHSTVSPYFGLPTENVKTLYCSYFMAEVLVMTKMGFNIS